MEQQWHQSAKELDSIQVTATPNNEPVSIKGVVDGFRCIGVGTDAAVFHSLSAPSYAFKIYATGKKDKLEAETEVYSKIGSSPYFSECYGSTDRLLVLKFEEGLTLFDCLLQGVRVPEQVIKDVESARAYVRECGLNPRDIHLKNILLQDGRAKLLDVSEYIKPGNDFRWEHLSKAYREYYRFIDGNPMPFWLLDTIRKWYNQWNKYASSFDEFMRFVFKQVNYRK